MTILVNMHPVLRESHSQWKQES